MPTYEYKREDGTTFEFFQSMSDEPLKVCPTTGQPVKRMISGGSGLLFKGSGFYVTDYKNGNKKGKKSEKENSKDDSKSTSADTSESKPSSTSSKDSSSGSKKETD